MPPWAMHDATQAAVKRPAAPQRSAAPLPPGRKAAAGWDKGALAAPGTIMLGPDPHRQGSGSSLDDTGLMEGPRQAKGCSSRCSGGVDLDASSVASTDEYGAPAPVQEDLYSPKGRGSLDLGPGRGQGDMSRDMLMGKVGQWLARWQLCAHNVPEGACKHLTACSCAHHSTASHYYCTHLTAYCSCAHHSSTASRYVILLQAFKDDVTRCQPLFPCLTGIF
jgi:hypothetical protein